MTPTASNPAPVEVDRPKGIGSIEYSEEAFEAFATELGRFEGCRILLNEQEVQLLTIDVEALSGYFVIVSEPVDEDGTPTGPVQRLVLSEGLDTVRVFVF